MARTPNPTAPAPSSSSPQLTTTSGSLDQAGHLRGVRHVISGLDVLTADPGQQRPGTDGLGGAPSPKVTINSIVIGEANLVNGATTAPSSSSTSSPSTSSTAASSTTGAGPDRRPGRHDRSPVGWVRSPQKTWPMHPNDEDGLIGRRSDGCDRRERADPPERPGPAARATSGAGSGLRGRPGWPGRPSMNTRRSSTDAPSPRQVPSTSRSSAVALGMPTSESPLGASSTVRWTLSRDHCSSRGMTDIWLDHPEAHRERAAAGVDHRVAQHIGPGVGAGQRRAPGPGLEHRLEHRGVLQHRADVHRRRAGQVDHPGRAQGVDVLGDGRVPAVEHRHLDDLDPEAGEPRPGLRRSAGRVLVGRAGGQDRHLGRPAGLDQHLVERAPG